MEKIKQFLKDCIESEEGRDILIVIIVILVGLGSFELGRLSKENISSGVRIEYPSQVTNQPASAVAATETDSMTRSTFDTSSTKQNSKSFFASKKGHKYYSIGCSAGKSIKQENRVYFTTGEEAQKAGYELSSSCI